MLKHGNNIKQRMKHVKALMQYVNATPDVTWLPVQRHTGSDVQEVERWDASSVGMYNIYDLYFHSLH